MENFTYKAIQTIKKSDKAEVIFASACGMDVPVIIKRLFEANQEVYRVIAKLQNIHIPKIYHIDETEHELLVAEEYIAGFNLGEYLSKESLNDTDKLGILMQLCEVLEVLHGCEPPIIHRDIKPSNILIGEDGVLKIIDFDTARQYSKDKSTGDTRLLGTIEYAAPEQFGYAQTDTRSDIYSIGVVLSEIKFKHLNVFERKWKKIINKCTSFDPERRYTTVAHVKRDIISCIRRIKYSGRKACISYMIIAGLLVSGGVMLVGTLLSNAIPEVSSDVSKDTILQKQEDATTTDLTTEVLQNTTYGNELIEGIVFKEDSFVREYSSSENLVCMLREDALCSIEKVYLCERPEEDDPFAERLTLLADKYYEIADNGKELILKAVFFETQAGKIESILYVEFSDGRGERLWITYK